MFFFIFVNEIKLQIFIGDEEIMSKKKLTEEEMQDGVGEIEIDIDSLEVEEADDEQPTSFAAEEEITGDEE